MQPNGSQVEAAIDALRQDAAMWLEMSGAMRAAAGVADRLDLTALHFSYLGDKLDMTDLYEQIKQLMVDYLRQGAENFDSIARALRTAAAGYEEDERNAVHRMRGIY